MKTYIFFCVLYGCTVRSTNYNRKRAACAIRRHLGLSERDSLNLIGVNL
jgi:hypothetical protein